MGAGLGGLFERGVVDLVVESNLGYADVADRLERERRVRALEKHADELKERAEEAERQLARISRPPDKPLSLTEEEKKKIRQAKGFDLNKYMIAIVGHAGHGKSTLINSMLAFLQSANPNPAASGVVETTMNQTTYPAGDTVLLIDVPGCGTTSFPLDTYIPRFFLKAMDAVIIVSVGRITDIDLKLYKALSEIGVKVFVARNKVDTDMKSKLMPLMAASGMMSTDELPVETVKGACFDLQQELRRDYVEKNVSDAFLISAFYYLYPATTYPHGISFDELQFFSAVAAAAGVRAPT